MSFKKSLAILALGAVLLLFGVAFSQGPPIFDPPVNLGPKINSPFYESDPFWDGPRKRLYFVSARPNNEDIWLADWTDTGWTNAQALGPEINTFEIEHSPSVSPDGQKLYFIRFPWNILVSQWDSMAGKWGVPVPLPCPVNTPGIEDAAEIGTDGSTLYFFSTNGTCDSFLQQSGLLFSLFDSITGWSVPQSLGPNINNGNGADYPSVTKDGKWLYFDRIVSDGISIFVSPWTGTMWGPAFDLRPQIGERAGTPSIVPSGDSLFFATPALSGFGSSDIFMMELMPTDVDKEKEKQALPQNFELSQNYPNPFNSQTRIRLFISRSIEGPVNLTVYNLLGQAVRALLKVEKLAGQKEVDWDGSDNYGKEVSSGIYFYELRVGEQRMVKKAVLIR